MIEIEVRVECTNCGNSEVDWVDDSWAVDNFISNLRGWGEDYDRCPDCMEPAFECSRCQDETTGDLEELGWTQFTDASMTGVITLCNHCSEQHAAIRA